MEENLLRISGDGIQICCQFGCDLKLMLFHPLQFLSSKAVHFKVSINLFKNIFLRDIDSII